MEIVNRAAIVISPGRPYLDWAGSLESGSSDPLLPPDDQTTVYLVNETKDFNITGILRRHWQTIFDEQLESWSRDPRNWPKNRTLGMFLEWFHVRIADMVFDLGAGILHHDD